MTFTYCPRLATPQKVIDGYCHEDQVLRFEAYFLPLEEDFETSHSFGHCRLAHFKVFVVLKT
jgi:hypothetical protein